MKPLAFEWLPSGYGQIYAENTTPSRWSYYYMINLFLVLLSGITFIVVAIASYQTTKLAWPQEKIIPGMLILLSLSLLGSFSFFLWSLLRVYQWPFPVQ